MQTKNVLVQYSAFETHFKKVKIIISIIVHCTHTYNVGLLREHMGHVMTHIDCNQQLLTESKTQEYFKVIRFLCTDLLLYYFYWFFSYHLITLNGVTIKKDELRCKG